VRHSLWQSFQFAGRGLREAVGTQRTMRVHVALAAAVTVAVAWLDLPAAGAAVVVLAVAAVLAAELVNTAVESVIDLQVGARPHAMAARAKDLAAAAVLVTAAGAAAAGVLVLGPGTFGGLAGMGLRVDAVTAGRAATLAAVLALALLALRDGRTRPGGRAAPPRGRP
jgi:diacylglycerol kinase (ATP)